MKLRSGRELKLTPNHVSSNKSSQNLNMTIILSAICGVYAGILAFIFVNSEMYVPVVSNLEIFINNSLTVIISEVTEMVVFLVTIFSRLHYHFSKWYLECIYSFVEYSVYSIYGIESMQCLSNYSK